MSVLRAPFVLVFRLPHFRETTVARLTAPAAIRAIPNGVATPVSANTAPMPRTAPLTVSMSVLRAPFVLVFRLPHFRATTVARPTAPAAMRAMPSGVATPVSANTAPMARTAPLTVSMSVLRAPFVLVFRLPHFRATTVTRPTAPAAIRAMPSGVATPVNASTAPMPRAAPLAVSTSVLRAPFVLVFRLPHFSATTVTRPTAPAAIRAMPSGVATPVNANTAPMARTAPLTSAVISPIGPCIFFFM